MKKTAFDIIVAHFGSVAETAQALGCTTQAVYYWRTRIPRGRALQIEAITRGKLKAVDLVRAA